ncbi:MAG TPA: hypothetical protein VHB45_10235 [Alloacidobacterium sp.]|nr:hypothetical protein [Alloacidobacterium sp.]
MSTIPLPALQIQSPQIDPLGSYERVLRLKALMGQQQLQNQQVQAGDLELQQRRQELAARQAMNQAFASSVTKDDSGKLSFDPDKLQSALMSGPAAYQAPQVMENLTKFQKARVDLQNSAADLQSKMSDITGAAAQAIKASGYDPSVAHGILDAVFANQSNSPQALQARSMIDNPQTLKQWTDTQIAQSPAQQKLQNAKDVANIRANNPEMQQMNDWLAKNPGKTPADYQQFKVDQGVQAAVAKETNPAVQRSKVQVAAAEGAARANMDAQIARGSNGALAQVPPHLVTQAADAATKAGQDYASAMQTSQDLKDTLELARNGNVTAFQVLPQEGVLQITTSQGVKRINMAEIQNYAGGGSLLQKIEGIAGKSFSGKSIPSSVLDDMAKVQQVQQKGAESKYRNSLRVINSNYGSDFQPVQMNAASSSLPPIETGYVRIQASDGSLHDLPQANLNKAKQRDPGLKVVNQ